MHLCNVEQKELVSSYLCNFWRQNHLFVPSDMCGPCLGSGSGPQGHDTGSLVLGLISDCVAVIRWTVSVTFSVQKTLPEESPKCSINHWVTIIWTRPRLEYYVCNHCWVQIHAALSQITLCHIFENKDLKLEVQSCSISGLWCKVMVTW